MSINNIININKNRMFKKKYFLIFIIPLIIITANCSNNKNKIKKPEKTPPLNILYKEAFRYFEQGKWNESIELFQKVETNYSFSEWAPRATIMIIYMYYEVGDSLKTLEYIKKYKKLYPTKKNLDYINFIKALTFYEQINVTSKDITYTKAALKEFKKIINNYPDSIYADESKLKIDLINEQLAGKEIYIARYYMNKSKWIPAIKRLTSVIENYGSTIYSKEALHRLVEIYYKLGNEKEARKYASILGYNFNDSDWYKKSYKIVEDKNYSPSNKKVKRKIKNRLQSLFKFSK